MTSDSPGLRTARRPVTHLPKEPPVMKIKLFSLCSMLASFATVAGYAKTW